MSFGRFTQAKLNMLNGVHLDPEVDAHGRPISSSGMDHPGFMQNDEFTVVMHARSSPWYHEYNSYVRSSARETAQLQSCVGQTQNVNGCVKGTMTSLMNTATHNRF